MKNLKNVNVDNLIDKGFHTVNKPARQVKKVIRDEAKKEYLGLKGHRR